MNVFDKDKTLLLWTPQMGLVVRQDGVLKYISKGVDASQELVDGEYEWRENHLAQPTASQQPRLVGGIAPFSKVAAANLNGESRYFTHPAISFGATDAWSVSFVINPDGAGASFGFLAGSANSGISILNNGRLLIYNESGTQAISNVGTISKLQGKNNTITLTALGDGSIKYYENGVYILTLTITSNFIFNGCLTARSDGNFSKISYYSIQSGAMSDAQVLAEYNLLRSIYPEIETVTIGSKQWSSSNFQAVATPQGNVIQEMQAAVAVEKITQPFTLSGWYYSGAININSNTFQATSSSGYAYITVLPATYKYVKIFYDFTSTGVVSISDGINVFKSGIPSGNSSGTFIVKTFNRSSLYIGLTGIGNTLQINNYSTKELGWAEADEIYNAVYAATSGDAATKEYAALKEAAMWRYPNNSIDKGSWAGKIYNKYAMKLLALDMASANFGYHIPTNAEVAELLAQVGGDTNKLKYVGLDYWNDAIGTNESGLTLLGTGVITPEGVYTGEKELTGFWTSDSNELPTSGLPIRIIKDYV